MWPGCYVKSPQTKWWDDYEGQPVVLFDEHNSAWFPWDYLLRMIDPLGLPLRVETKGGSKPMMATTFIFTTNREPKEWYTDEKFDMHALYRRITEIWRFQVFLGAYVINKSPGSLCPLLCMHRRGGDSRTDSVPLL